MTPDHEMLREWLDLEADGGLGEAESERLSQHLASCDSCQAENRDVTALVSLLTASRVDVRPGFGGAVMQALPAPGWLPAAKRGYGLVAALFGLLVVSAAMMANMAETGGGSVGPLAGILLAIGGLVKSSILATGGLLGASWQGMGMAFSDIWSNSPGQAIALGVGIVLLDIVFLRLLGRTRRALGAAPASDGRRQSG